MANRREFIQAGAAISALPLLSNFASPAWASASGMPRLSKAVFDCNFSEGQTFGDEAKRLGIPIHSIDGDITDLWYNDLYHHWKQPGPTAIAGLTGVSSLFCLERFAWKSGLRVLFRADHTQRPDGAVEHRLSGPAELLKRADLNAGRCDWAAGMAQLAAGYSAGMTGPPQTQLSRSSAASQHSQHWIEPLATWIIGPRVQS